MYRSLDKTLELTKKVIRQIHNVFTVIVVSSVWNVVALGNSSVLSTNEYSAIWLPHCLICIVAFIL